MRFLYTVTKSKLFAVAVARKKNWEPGRKEWIKQRAVRSEHTYIWLCCVSRTRSFFCVGTGFARFPWFSALVVLLGLTSYLCSHIKEQIPCEVRVLFLNTESCRSWSFRSVWVQTRGGGGGNHSRAQFVIIQTSVSTLCISLSTRVVTNMRIAVQMTAQTAGKADQQGTVIFQIKSLDPTNNIHKDYMIYKNCLAKVKYKTT